MSKKNIVSGTLHETLCTNSSCLKHMTTIELKVCMGDERNLAQYLQKKYKISYDLAKVAAKIMIEHP